MVKLELIPTQKLILKNKAQGLHSSGYSKFLENQFTSYTGCAIKNWWHSFNHTCSHDRNPSNFKTAFICYYTELSFEVYNFLLGQLAYKWEVIKVWSSKQKSLKKVYFTSLTGNNLNFSAIFWTCSCQSTPMLVFQLKIKQLQVKIGKKNQIITCPTTKMHLLQTFLFWTSNFDESLFLRQLT